MNTRHSRGISRADVEQLLDGRLIAGDPGTDQLARVLAAAAAPARDAELAGEQMAMAAFETHHLATSATPQKEHTSMLAKIFTAKVLFSSLAAFATGGVALAAGTGALHGAHPATVHHGSVSGDAPTVSAVPSLSPGVVPSAPAVNVPPTHAALPLPTGVPSSTVPSATPSAPASSTSPALSLPTTAAGLCTALAGDVDSVAGSTLSPAGLVQALSKTSVARAAGGAEFSSLVTTAGSAANVADYCALLLDLPQLPDPSQLAALPGTVLGQLLTALPVSALATDLSSLPASALSQVLTAVPVSALSQLLTSLPSSVVSQLLSELPASTLSTLLSELPAAVLATVLAELPSSLLSQLPGSILGQL